MADITMAVVECVRTGLLDIGTVTGVRAGNAAGTDDWLMPNDGKTVLAIDGVTGDTWTFQSVADKYGRTESLTPTVGAGKFALIGPFVPEIWNDGLGRLKFKPSAGGNPNDKLLAVRVTP